MNFDRLRFVAERAELGEAREAIFAVTIPERPGSFREFCALLGKRSVTEFNYRYADPQRRAHLRRRRGRRSARDRGSCCARCTAQRIEAYDLSDNEMAKLHVRHLVGGHAPAAENEILYRFEFPERPGALMRFLDSMSRGWNISLFHYRNHGADYGRVLVGMQVPPADHADFRRFLERLGYYVRRRDGQPGLPDVSRTLAPPGGVAATNLLAGTARQVGRLTVAQTAFFGPRTALLRRPHRMKSCARRYLRHGRFAPCRPRAVTRYGSFLLKFAVPMLQIAQKPQLCPFWQGLCSRHLVLYRGKLSRA